MTWSDRKRPLLAALALLVMGCGRREPGFSLLPLVQARTYVEAGLTFRRPPEITALKIDNERRPAVLAAAGTWTWRGEVPAKAVLHVGVQALPAVWRAVSRLDVEVALRQGSTREILDVAKDVQNRTDPSDPTDPSHPAPPNTPRWLDLEIDLAPWAGREVTLEFSSSLTGLPPSYRDANLVAWSPVVLEGSVEKAERPNVLFIVVDTLRADHLTPYGYKVHDTTPEIQRRLAGPGTVVENAYSQAPWTLPSVVSFMTGRYPGELLGDDAASFGIPAGVKTLAERMAAAGYDTGGFIANPVLHEGAGYERGFHTSYAPPADIEWIRRHADDLNRHAVPWLRSHQWGAHQRRPFFLYVHYVDPHDPYENPDMVAGRAQFMPDYKGNVSGDWIHGIYSGKLQLADPALDLAYIKALYDGEVHYVDRHIGALLDAIDPEVLKNTLIVLTADHGEELYDHGGWKHGQTLYEEQIHVPLIFRWDGRIPAGKRLPGTVRLLDLVPTLMAAAGSPSDPAWEGVDLLPALTGKEPAPRRPSFSEGLSGGPLRAAAVLDRKKLLLFNREEPFRPNDELQDFLWHQDLARFQRAELYDLSRDAGERRNLAGDQPDGSGVLAPLIHRQLSRELEGLWVIPDGLPEGSRLSGSITFERAPALWTPYFLGPADKAELSGGKLRFDLVGERLAKGLRIPGDVGKILAVEAALDGRPLPPGAVRIGTEAPWGRPSATPLLRLWTVKKNAERRTAVDPETEKRLTNLGYIGAKEKRKTP
jgi:arylsulfatase A-like enzyme